MSQLVVLDDIGFACDAESLLNRLRLVLGAPRRGQVEELVRQAKAVARPKALYRAMPVAEADQDRLVLDGASFPSATLRRAVRDAPVVFPFLATCGRELEAWAAGVAGLLNHYLADIIMGMALEQANAALQGRILRHRGPEGLDCLEPGIPPDWPASELRPLLAVLGDAERHIGVRLSPEGMMRPLKSVAGILFPARTALGKCVLCPRELCPERTAAFAPDRVQ